MPLAQLQTEWSALPRGRPPSSPLCRCPTCFPPETGQSHEAWVGLPLPQGLGAPLDQRFTRDAPAARHRDKGPALTYSVSRLDSEEKFWASVL